MEKDNCPVCLMEFDDDDTILKLNCNLFATYAATVNFRFSLVHLLIDFLSLIACSIIYFSDNKQLSLLKRQRKRSEIMHFLAKFSLPICPSLDY